MGFDVSRRYGLGGTPELLPRGKPFKFNVRDAVCHVYNDVLSFLEGDQKNREWRQTSHPGYIDVFEGFRGVMVKPDAFPEAAWDIPDRFYVADDVWLSGHAAAAGARSWMLDIPMNRQRIEAQAKISPLFGLIHEGMDRNQLYKDCIRYFQDTHGVWR